MKITGKHFRRGMKDNSIIIKNGFIAIHSSDGDCGIFRKMSNETAKDTDESLNFNLSSKDFALLSKFEDLKVDVTGETVVFKTKASTFKIQNYEHTFSSPQREGRKELNVPINILEKAGKFADSSRAGSAGVLVYPTCVIGTTGSTLFKIGINTGESLIHIPLSLFKTLEGQDYQLTSTEKHIFATKDGEIVYSNLYEEKTPKLDEYDPIAIGHIKCDANQLKEHLSFAENFGKYVFLEIKNDVLNIQSVVDEGNEKNFVAKVKLETSNIENYKKAFNISNLIKILNAVDTNEIGFDERSIILRKNNELAMTMVYTRPEAMDLVVKKEEEK